MRCIATSLSARKEQRRSEAVACQRLCGPRPRLEQTRVAEANSRVCKASNRMMRQHEHLSVSAKATKAAQMQITCLKRRRLRLRARLARRGAP